VYHHGIEDPEDLRIPIWMCTRFHLWWTCHNKTLCSWIEHISLWALHHLIMGFILNICWSYFWEWAIPYPVFVWLCWLMKSPRQLPDSDAGTYLGWCRCPAMKTRRPKGRKSAYQCFGWTDFAWYKNSPRSSVLEYNIIISSKTPSVKT
jgi:hypothetical protein